MKRYQFRVTIKDNSTPDEPRTVIKCWSGASEELARRGLLDHYFKQKMIRVRKVELVPWEQMTP